MRGAVFQVDAGEISWRAAKADNRFARLQAAHMDLERKQEQPHSHGVNLKKKKRMKSCQSEKENTGRPAPLIALVIKSIIVHYHNCRRLHFALESVTKLKNREFKGLM